MPRITVLFWSWYFSPFRTAWEMLIIECRRWYVVHSVLVKYCPRLRWNGICQPPHLKPLDLVPFLSNQFIFGNDYKYRYVWTCKTKQTTNKKNERTWWFRSHEFSKVPVDKFPGNSDDVAIVIKKRMIPFCTTVLLKRHRKRWSFREFESSYRL